MRSDPLANLTHKLTELLCEIDPLDICDVPDEYEPEAREIAERVLVRAEEFSSTMLREVFEKWFGAGCLTDEECVAAHTAITRSLADDRIRAGDLYRDILEKTE